MVRFACIIASFFVALLVPVHAAENTAPSKLLVLIPQLNAAYDRVFNEIIRGISTHDDVDIYTFNLTSATLQEDIQEKIDAEKIDAVIALGQSSYEIASQFHLQLPVIHGGMIISPNNHSGISLAASPEGFFSHLKIIAPTVKRVFTVYSEDNNGWIVDLAREKAGEYDIELQAFKANSARQAVNHFRNILEQTNDPSDAVWLLLDRLIPEQTVLPLVLDAAWKKHIVLFSNNPSDSKRGALFSLFPDHYKMGYRLAELSLKQIESNQPTVWPLSSFSLKVSVNERTASHLGIRYTNEELAFFDIVYPQR